jgi:hypothetical protein
MTWTRLVRGYKIGRSQVKNFLLQLKTPSTHMCEASGHNRTLQSLDVRCHPPQMHIIHRTSYKAKTLSQIELKVSRLVSKCFELLTKSELTTVSRTEMIYFLEWAPGREHCARVCVLPDAFHHWGFYVGGSKWCRGILICWPVDSCAECSGSGSVETLLASSLPLITAHPRLATVPFAYYPSASDSVSLRRSVCRATCF